MSTTDTDLDLDDPDATQAFVAEKRVEAEIYRKQGQRYAAEAAAAGREITEANYATLLHAVDLKAHEARVVQQDIDAARQRGDVDAEIQARKNLDAIVEDRRIIQAGIDELEGKPETTLIKDGNVVREVPVEQAQRMQQHQSVETMLATLPNLTNDERAWIRAHPDSLLDQRNQRLMSAAYEEAEMKGIRRGSPEYFAHFEQRLYGRGVTPEPARHARADAEEYPDEPAPRTAAPVSRGGSVERPLRSGQVMLTPAQREAARISGVDEVTYAEQWQRLQAEKRRGNYA